VGAVSALRVSGHDGKRVLAETVAKEAA
jgi:hypothetical protein